MSGDNERSDSDSFDVAKRNATGAGQKTPISLLDDDDDDDDDFRLPLETRTTQVRRRIVKNRDRPQQPRKDNEVLATSKKKAKLRNESETTILPSSSASRHKNKDDDGCMLNPRHPIKIFATDRDKAVRRRLRRRLASQSTNGSANQEKEYNNHWSTSHCWTFREMLGFDRFSGLRNQKQQQQAIVPKSIGIDWIFITTYILDVDFLLNELPELITVPTVIIVYQYKDSSPSGREEAWVKTSSSKGHTLRFLVRNPRAPPGTTTNPLGSTMDYGCHHTKMTLMGYSSGRLRVHIHTSNLRREDVHDKCQGAFLQDFLPKTEDQLANFVTSPFEESLATYLESYEFLEPLVWTKEDSGERNGDAETLVSNIQTYDFSKAVGVLIPSIPGYHKNIRINSNTESCGQDKIYGYLKVKQAIRDHCGKNRASNEKHHRSSSIVCQFSSMGSLSKPYLNKIADAWNTSAVTAVTDGAHSSPKLGKQKSSSSSSSLSLLKIVWPTVEEIVTSVEGIQGGASVPGRTKNLHKDFLRPLLHKWRSESSNPNDDDNYDDGDDDDDQLLIDKGHHVPHIKSYYQMISNGKNKTPNGSLHESNSSSSNSAAAANNNNNQRDTTINDMLWFVLSSHNLSKAAWGEIQNRMDPRGGGHRREVLVIQHWELGVFVSPSTLGVEAMGPLLKLEANRSNHASRHEGKRAVIPLPYKIRPHKYQDSDRPWVVE